MTLIVHRASIDRDGRAVLPSRYVEMTNDELVDALECERIRIGVIRLHRQDAIDAIIACLGGDARSAEARLEDLIDRGRLAEYESRSETRWSDAGWPPRLQQRTYAIVH